MADQVPTLEVEIGINMGPSDKDRNKTTDSNLEIGLLV